VSPGSNYHYALLRDLNPGPPHKGEGTVRHFPRRGSKEMKVFGFFSSEKQTFLP
jgi:hypothetical protein